MTQKIIVITLVGLFLQFVFASNSFAQTAGRDKVAVVVIDAGHGGKDPGCVGKVSYEKNIVLDVAKKVGNLITQNYKDVKVLYTRDSDVFIELGERANIANRNNADLFISIHVNATDASSASHGTETFVMGLHKNEANLAVAKRENSVILQEDDYSSKYDGFDPNDPENHIIFSLFQNMYLDQSLILAASVQDQFTNSLKRFNRGVKQAGFLVLWKTAMPSILVELGFISNPEEEKYLTSQSGQNELATAIYNAFSQYKANYEKSSPKFLNKPAAEPKPEAKPAVQTEKPKTEEPKASTQTNEGEIIFKIQIKTSDVELEKNEANFKQYANEISFYKQGNTFKYTIGEDADYNNILKLQKQLKTEFEGCFIIAFQNGERIDTKTAIEKFKNK